MGINKLPLSRADFRRREKTPLYARLQTRLQQLIETGHWKPNDQLPTERELAEATGISINTVKSALHNLVLEGYLHRRQGAGTFVTSPEDFFGLHRYFGMQKDFSFPLERHKKVVLSRPRVLAPEAVGAHFDLGGPVECFRLERLLFIGGGKTVHTVSWLPVELFKGFDSVSDETIVENPLYHILATKFNMPCRISKELLSLEQVPEAIADHLEIAHGSPVLYSKLIAYSYRQKAFELRESHIVTGALKLYREF